MRAIVMRVSNACVQVEGDIVSEIGKGLLVLVGFGKEDAGKIPPSPSTSSSSSGIEAESCSSAEVDLKWMASKLVTANYWPDETGKHWAKSVGDVEGDILIVSQFTLFGVITKGKRPTF